MPEAAMPLAGETCNVPCPCAKTHAAPALPLSKGPPTMAVLPSPDNATDRPWSPDPTAPVPTSLLPCCVQTPLLRVKTHAAPVKLLSVPPPIMAVLPSPDSETETPCADPTAPVPTSLLPCCVHTVPLRVK